MSDERRGTPADESQVIEPPAGEIDLVAEPIRYPRSPLIALLVIAVVPTLALYLLQRWADSEADAYEASSNAVTLTGAAIRGGIDLADAGASGASGEAGEAGAAEELATAVLDYRRAPSAVADVAHVARLESAVASVIGSLDDSSCAAVSVDGIEVASTNPDTPLIPASTQKLLVAAVALEVLGPDHTFTTSVAVPAPVEGVIDGDIYLIGGGDPLLTSDDYPIEDDRRPAFNTTSFDQLADAVAASGVTRITGTVIGDGSRYDDEFFVEEWAPGIAGVDAGPYGALLANDGRVRGRSSIESDPAQGAAREFVRLLGDRGVRVDNGWGSGEASTLVPEVGAVESEPLSEVVAEMLTNSDNNTAELLLKELGVVVYGEGTRAAGLQVLDSTLRSWGVPMAGVRVRDGSGLSNANQLTCPAILAVLQRGAGGPLEDGLAIAARTGTLDDEFVESPMAGRLYGKTGTLGNAPADEDPPAVKALSGYVGDTGAGTIEFALVLNGPDVDLERVYQPVWLALGERFATYPSGPSDATLSPR